MPFTGASDPNLPSNVEGLSLEKRKEWVGVWNGRFKACRDDGDSEGDCESSAFAVANAAIKELKPAFMETAMSSKAAHLDDDDDDKKKPRRKKPKDKMATMPDADKAAIATKFFGGMQLTQEETQYTSTGGGQERACANCRWYLPYRDYDACAIVEDWPAPITPNGLSNRWEAISVFKPDPMEVIIVGESSLNEDEAEAVVVKVPAGMKDRAVALLRGLKDRVTPTPKGNPSMFFTKDANGQMRWFAITSNNYRDSDNPPEIFEEKAHKEFVSYLDNGGTMPELWYWHEPGLKWGQSDWVDYVDGFLMFGGTIDPGFEHVAEKVAADPNLGISHGYGYTYSDQKNGIIGWYRTFEISPLPMSKAANKWTGLALIQKEVAMEFSAEKRPDAIAKYGEDFVKEMEGERDVQAKIVADLKIESKQRDDPPADGESTPEEKAAAESSDKLAMKMAGTAADLILSSKAFADLGTKIDGVTTDMTAVKERLAVLEQSDDEKVAAILSGKGRKLGQRASESGENTVDPNDPVVKETAPQLSTLDIVHKEMFESMGVEQPVT